MKLIQWIFAVAFSIAGVPGSAANTPQQQVAQQQQDWVFHGCNEIKALEDEGRTKIRGGSVTFTGMIECADMALLEFSGDTIIKSQGDMHTKNLLFMSGPDVRAVFSAPTVTLEQGEHLRDNDIALLWGVGTFEFEVTKQLPGTTAGAPVDEHGLTQFIGGDVRSRQQVLYTEGAIIASRPPAVEASTSPDDQPTGSNMFPTDPYLLNDLAKQHARIFGDDNDPTSTAAGDVVDTRGGVSSSADGDFSRVPDKNSWTAGRQPQQQQPSPNPWTTRNARSTGTGTVVGSGVGSSGDDIIYHPEITAHPELFLKAGDQLEGLLMYWDHSAAVSVSHVDGSVRLAKAVGSPPLNEDGKQFGPQPLSYATALASDSTKVMEVHRRRHEIIAEEKEKEEEEEGTRAKQTTKKSKIGRKERKLRERAREHLGEVTLTLSDRGVVEVTMDGTTVLKKGGPSFLGYRRKDASYRLRPTRKGFEVLRRGTVKWTITTDGNGDYIVP